MLFPPTSTLFSLDAEGGRIGGRGRGGSIWWTYLITSDLMALAWIWRLGGVVEGRRVDSMSIPLTFDIVGSKSLVQQMSRDKTGGRGDCGNTLPSVSVAVGIYHIAYWKWKEDLSSALRDLSPDH